LGGGETARRRTSAVAGSHDAAAGQNGVVATLVTPLERLREIAERDVRLAAEAGAVAALSARTVDVRRRASEVVDTLRRLPAAIAACETAVAESRTRRRSAEAALDAARSEAEAEGRGRRGREQRLAAAKATLLAAEHTLLDLCAHVDRLERERVGLEQRERTLRAEAIDLLDLAGTLAREIAAAPRVAGTGVEVVPSELAELDDWGVRARAALFIARGSIDAERERVVADACAVGSAALGEDVSGLSVDLLLRRVEAAAI
jgi:hypothetical protein